MAIIMTTESVLGCVKLCSPLLYHKSVGYSRRSGWATDAEGHAFLPVLSAQGSNDVQLIFQPPHMEYVAAPQPGQNYSDHIRHL